MTAAHAFAGPGSLTVAQLLNRRNYVTVDALFERLGKPWTRTADYDGRHFKAERVRTELPTEEIPVVVEPVYLSVPKWRTWLAIVGTVAAVLMVALLGAAVSDEINDPPVPALVRSTPGLPAWTIPGGVR